MNFIASAQNPVIKEIKSLKKKKDREEKGLFFIEGLRFVNEAFDENIEVISVLMSEQFTSGDDGRKLLSAGTAGKYKCYILPDNLFKEISDTENPQGIMAVVKARRYKLEELVNGCRLLVVLDSIQDPGNMGTIIRTADAAGADGVILSKGCVDLYNPKVLRSTMGSIFHLPVYISDNLVETVSLLKSKGIFTIAAHLKGGKNFYDLDMKDATAIIIGNEANGISDEVAGCADELVRIPMPGRAESLNASVAAGLMIYEAVRQRLQG